MKATPRTRRAQDMRKEFNISTVPDIVWERDGSGCWMLERQSVRMIWRFWKDDEGD